MTREDNIVGGNVNSRRWQLLREDYYIVTIVITAF